MRKPNPAVHTPRHMLEAFNATNADAFRLHSVVDVEASASGEVLRSETVVRPGGGAGPVHRHMFQEERFEIIEGEIVGCLRGAEAVYGPGDVFLVPPGTPHTFRVESDAPARFVTEFRPALRIAEFFAQIFWLADNGHVDRKGRINPFQAAVLAREFPHEFFYVPAVPVALQQLIARPLATFGRARGFSADPAGLPVNELATTRAVPATAV